MTDEEPGTAIVKRSATDIVEHLRADLSAAHSEAKAAKAKVKMRRAMAGLVFAYWTAKYDHPRALLDQARERRIMQRLEECQDKVSDLLWALDGARKDKWVMGEDRHSDRKYDGIEVILRDRSQVEKFAEKTKGFREDKDHPMWVKYGTGGADVGA